MSHLELGKALCFDLKLVYPSLVSRSTADGVESRAPYENFFLQRYAEAYVAELHAFVDLARGRTSESPTFDDGRAALILADAAQKSATERVPVEVHTG